MSPSGAVLALLVLSNSVLAHQGQKTNKKEKKDKKIHLGYVLKSAEVRTPVGILKKFIQHTCAYPHKSTPTHTVEFECVWTSLN